MKDLYLQKLETLQLRAKLKNRLAPMHIYRRFIHRIADHPCLLHACMHAQSCLTLCNPMDCSPPGFSVHGISQAKILEWDSISYSNLCLLQNTETLRCLEGGKFAGYSLWKMENKNWLGRTKMVNVGDDAPELSLVPSEALRVASCSAQPGKKPAFEELHPLTRTQFRLCSYSSSCLSSLSFLITYPNRP